MLYLESGKIKYPLFFLNNNNYFIHRSSSTENEFHDKPPIRGSLYRKSLSLEQNFGNTEQVSFKTDIKINKKIKYLST